MTTIVSRYVANTANMTTNTERIDQIHAIVRPYFAFYMGDTYGDSGCCGMPPIDSLTLLPFKRIPNKHVAKAQIQDMVDRITELEPDVSAELATIGGIGQFIMVTLRKSTHTTVATQTD